MVGDFIYNLRDKLSDTEEPYLWSDNELISYVNYVIKDIIANTGFLQDNYPFNTSKDVMSYSLPSDFFRIKSVYCDGLPLAFIPYSMVHYNAFNVSAKPKFYTYNKENIYLLPTPDDIYSVNVVYEATLGADLTANDTIPLREEWMFLLLYGVMWQAYLKDDTETFNQKAQYYEAQYRDALKRFKNFIVRNNNFNYTIPVHRGLI